MNKKSCIKGAVINYSYKYCNKYVLFSLVNESSSKSISINCLSSVTVHSFFTLLFFVLIFKLDFIIQMSIKVIDNHGI